LCESSTVETLGGEQLIERRVAAGYSREEFAPLVGIEVRTLEGWEARSGRVPPRKRSLVERVLEQPKAELSTLELLGMLASRLAAGEAASKRLAELETEHPDWFSPSTDSLPQDASGATGSAVVSPVAPSGEGVSRGHRKAAPKRRIIKGDDHE